MKFKNTPEKQKEEKKRKEKRKSKMKFEPTTKHLLKTRESRVPSTGPRSHLTECALTLKNISSPWGRAQRSNTKMTSLFFFAVQSKAVDPSEKMR